VEALDTQTNAKVAIKIIRAIPKYRDASKIEVRVLQKLKERDPLNRKSENLIRGVAVTDIHFLVNVSICYIGSTTGTTYVLSQSSWECVCTIF
jgi:hypothetical protein